MAPPLSPPPQQQTSGRSQTQLGSSFESFLVIFLSALRGLVECSHFVLKGNFTWHQAPPLKGRVRLKSFASPTPNRFRSRCPGARRAQTEGRRGDLHPGVSRCPHLVLRLSLDLLGLRGQEPLSNGSSVPTSQIQNSQRSIRSGSTLNLHPVLLRGTRQGRHSTSPLTLPVVFFNFELMDQNHLADRDF